VIIGGSTLGNSLNPNKLNPTTPKSMITIERTEEKTGLLMLIEAIFILLIIL